MLLKLHVDENLFKRNSHFVRRYPMQFMFYLYRITLTRPWTQPAAVFLNHLFSRISTITFRFECHNSKGTAISVAPGQRWKLWASWTWRELSLLRSGKEFAGGYGIVPLWDRCYHASSFSATKSRILELYAIMRASMVCKWELSCLRGKKVNFNIRQSALSVCGNFEAIFHWNPTSVI